MFRTLLSVVVLAVAMTAPSIASAQTPQPTGARPSARKAPAGIVNLNTASATELQALPGIGAKTAERILEYRQKNGPFKKIEELMNIRGVGEKNFLKLKNQITVAAARAEQGAKP